MSTNDLAMAIKTAMGLPMSLVEGTVTAINGDGTITVNIRGANTSLNYLNSYYPTVGDKVEISAFGSTMVVVGCVNSVNATSAMPLIQSAVVPITITPVGSTFTQAVTFPVPYNGIPFVAPNITSASGPTAKWMVRATAITSTGFNLFFLTGDGTTGSFSGVGVGWLAVGF